jgi:hypothetical protein
MLQQSLRVHSNKIAQNRTEFDSAIKHIEVQGIHQKQLTMSYFPHDSYRTDVTETNLKYKAFQGMLSSSADSYVDFMTKKLEAVVAMKDPVLRLDMIQCDKWLNAGFNDFHKEASSFPLTVNPPLYISKPIQYKRAECEKCEDKFECSRNYKGKVIMCARCDANDAYKKKPKIMAVEPDNAAGGDKSASSPDSEEAVHSVAIRDNDEDDTRKRLDQASWRSGR